MSSQIPTGGDPAGAADFDSPVGGDPAGGDADLGAGGGDGGEGDDDGGIGDFDPNSVEARAAAEFEAEVLGGDPSASEDGSPAGEPDELDSFIRKNYGGDKSALLAGIYESRSEGRRLAEKVAELEAKLGERAETETRDRDAEFKAARDSHQVVRAIDQDMRAIEARVKGIDARQLQIADTVKTLNSQIDKFEGQISREEDPTRVAQLRTEMIELKQERRALMGEFQVNDGVRDSKASAYNSLARELARAEQEIRDDMEFREHQLQSKRQSDQRTVQDFDTAFITALRGFDTDPKGEQARYLYRSSKEILAGELERRKGPALTSYEIQQAVVRLMEHGAKMLGLKKRASGSAPAGRRPNPAQRQVRPVAPRQVLTPRPRREDPNADDDGESSGRPRPPRDLDEALSDPDFVRRRANRVFSAQANKTARRGRIT